MAVKAVNDTAGYDGIVPTLLVFGAFPRISETDPPAPSIVKRAAAIKKAMSEVSRLRAKRQVTDALRTRNGPITMDIPIGSDVLVWRIHEKKWTGPHTSIAIKDETVTVQTTHGPTNFRTTCVKRYDNPNAPQVIAPVNNNTAPQLDAIAVPRRQPARNAGLPLRYRENIFMNNELQPDFIDSRQKELNGLLDRGVFGFININDIPLNARIFNSRFVDRIKNEGKANAIKKSRLVVQAYKDDNKKSVLTYSPTIQRMSQRLILSLALYNNFDIFTRDISQAYTQSKSHLARDFYVRPPKELALPADTLLKVLRPLYGVPEVGTHWFQTYHNHHVQKLDLKYSSYDPCLLFNRDEIVGLQTDDTIAACSPQFGLKEDKELHKAKFDAKPVQKLTNNSPIIFNGAYISRSNTYIFISQHDQVSKISLLKDASKHEYVSQRARGAYIASVYQPQVSFGLSRAAQTTNPDNNDISKLTKSLKWQLENSSRGLKFLKLIGKLRIITFTDSSFANNPDLSSQLGYLIVLADEHNNCNIIHWSSVKCKRITRSVIASELYAMCQGFDTACVLKDTVDKIIDEEVPIIVCIDSFSLFECLVKLGTTREKRLMIDLKALRQAYERREIAEIIWITGESNPADALTKYGGNQALEQLINTNKVDLKAGAWVER
ncbi:hypothetical protein K3495_g77 [Podosphaera aphanis]|nr:hypothetical protein K3495_g77 [Podosphaera aphanis]